MIRTKNTQLLILIVRGALFIFCVREQLGQLRPMTVFIVDYHVISWGDEMADMQRYWKFG